MPQLDMNSTIGFIDSVKNLSAGHPVFLIGCTDDGSYLVLKQDQPQMPVQNARQSVGHTLKIMNAVNPAAQSKVLSPQEIENLKGFCKSSYAMNQLGLLAESPDIGLFRGYLNGMGQWFKMKKAEGILGLDGAIASFKANADKTGVRAIAKSLNDAGGFETLGRIIAVDLYNHNHDRFSFAGYGALNPMTDEATRFHAICNLGNVLLSVDQGKLKPVGLDSFDPTSDYHDLSQTIAQLDAGKQEIDMWAGHHLNPSTDQRSWLKNYMVCIHADLNAALGPRNRKIIFATKERLNKDGPARMLRGAIAAIDQIKARLRDMVRKPNAPAGLASRLNALG